MRISTNQIQLSMLDNLQQGFGEYARLDRQISSNKRILQPSDDPVGSVQLLGLKKEQAVAMLGHIRHRMEEAYAELAASPDRELW